MGFWHTGYIEFHEPVGFGEAYTPSPPVYRCQHCAATFDNSENLLAHRFEAHPFNRPVLFVRGGEIGNTPLRITRSLKAVDIKLGHCTKAWLNGHPIPIKDFGKRLAGKLRDTVVIKLANGDVEAEFRLTFEIPSESDLDGVEQCFLAVVKKKRLDLRAIDEFISAASAYPTAIGYCDGVCEYFYGVLAKERSPDSSLPYSAYREKFTRAADKLKDYDRALSRTIFGLIAFQFNQFDLWGDQMSEVRVCLVSERFNYWLKGDPLSANGLLDKEFDDRIEKLLTDCETEMLISLALMKSEAVLKMSEDIESKVRQDIPEFDRAKLHILLAENYAQQGRGSDAKRHARELRNNPAFGMWAERLLGRVEEKE